MKRNRTNETTEDTTAGAEEQRATSTSPRTRRDFLKYGGAAAVGLVAGTMLPGEGAEAGHGAGVDPDALHLGENNEATQPTVLSSDFVGTSLLVENDDGTAIAGHSQAASGLFAVNSTGEGAVWGQSSSGGGVVGETGAGGPFGVKGEAVDGDGVRGFSNSGYGVDGNSSNQVGVHGVGPVAGVQGESDQHGMLGHAHGVVGIGVEGESDQFIGVQGSGPFRGVAGFGGVVGVLGQSPGSNPAVLAESRVIKGDLDSGLALQVRGKAEYSNAGPGVIPTGQAASDPISPPNGLTANSHVKVTLTSDPGSNRVVQWVETDLEAGTFTVHMTPGSKAETTFKYSVEEHP